MDHNDIKRILLIMSSIGKVEYHIGDDFVGFYRDETLFGKVQDGILHLLSDKDKFVTVSAECLHNKIMLLPQLKKAYVSAID
jgi:hypothetical protein